MPIQIFPSLFIGLGTNGWNIIDHLRQLVYEEFGAAGLPCFRYIALETNKEKRSPDGVPTEHPYERITGVYIPLPQTSILRQRIDPSDTDHYRPHMADWLDPRIIVSGEASYEAGAGNSRQVGRACLWEHWKDRVAPTISNAYTEITDQRNRSGAADFLRRSYFPKKGQATQDEIVNLAPKIYIFGTLCGGTCSGTFLDIAYFVSQLVHAKANAGERIGMFTTVDSLSATTRQAANCAAALHELDYYCRATSEYAVEFPDGTRINAREQPFDTLYLVGRRNLQNIGFQGTDTDELTRMCAMNLFTEVVAGMAGKKAEGRVDFRENIPGYMKPKADGYLRAFSSFGLSAISYPRYRITQAMSRGLAVAICDEWLLLDVNRGKVEEPAKLDWEAMLKLARGSLLGNVPDAQNHVDLVAQVDAVFSYGQVQFESAEESALDGIAFHYPDDQSTFSQKLSRSPAGEYFRRISDPRELVLKQMKETLTKQFNVYVRDHTLKESITYIEIIADLVRATLTALPEEVAPLSQRLDLSLSATVHHDWWSRLLGRRSQVIADYRRALWDDLKQRVMGQMEMIRDSVLRTILPGLLEQTQKLREQLTQAEQVVSALKNECATQRKDRETIQHHNNIVVVSKGEDAVIADDVREGVDKIILEKGHLELRRQLLKAAEPNGVLNFLLTVDKPDLVKLIDITFGGMTRERAEQFKIDAAAIDRLRPQLRDLLVSSHPYVETIATWRREAPRRLPNFLFCNDSKAGALLSAKNVELFPDQTLHYDLQPSPLDHFAFLYQECCGLAVSDLEIHAASQRALRDAEDDPNRIATSFSHQRGRSYFSVERAEETSELNRWIGAMSKVHSEIFISGAGGRRALSFTGADRLNRVLEVDQPDQVRRHVEEHGSKRLLVMFQQKLQALGKEAVIERINRYVDALTDPAARVEQGRLLESIFKKTFPEAAEGVTGR